MSSKAILYILVTIVVLWSLDSININQIFKKNREIQAKVFYMLLALSLIYLITNFIYDFFLITKIWGAYESLLLKYILNDSFIFLNIGNIDAFNDKTS